MPTIPLERCENCGQLIGRLETPCLHHGHVVCAGCKARLEASNGLRTFPTAGSPPLPPSVPIAAGSVGCPRGMPGVGVPRASAMPSALRLLKLAVITVAVFIVALVVLFRLIIMLAGSASSSGAGIGSPWAGQPVDPRFTLTRVFDEYPPVSWAAWKIVNQDSSPLTVKAVILNGEYVAPLASQLGPQFFVAKEQSFPVWLSIGNSGLFFEHGAGISSVNYLKDVIFVDVFTNRGNYRYRCNDGLFVRLTADDEKGDASAVRQYVPMADAKTQERRDSADQQINMLNALRLRGSEPYIPPGMQEPKDLPAGLTGANPRAAGGANSTAPQTQPAPRIQRVAEHWLQRDVPKKQSALERPNQGPQK